MKQDLTVVEIAVFTIYPHAQCDIYDFEQVHRQINLHCPRFKDTWKTFEIIIIKIQ